MNGFEKHGITHLSASSINLWAAAPDVWTMQYLHGLRTPFNSPAPWRGIVVEDAVVETLMGGSEQEAIANALAKFDQKFMIGDEKTTKEREMVQPMVQIEYLLLLCLVRTPFIPLFGPLDLFYNKVEYKNVYIWIYGSLPQKGLYPPNRPK